MTNRSTQKWIYWQAPILIVGALLLLGLGFYAWMDLAYASRVFPGVRLGSVSLGGLSLDEANNRTGTLLAGIDEQSISLNSDTISRIYALSQLGITFDAVATVNQINRFGRDSNPLVNFGHRLQAVLAGVQSPVSHSFSDVFSEVSSQLAADLRTPSFDAEIIIQNQLATVKSASLGHILDKAKLFQLMSDRINQLDFSDLILPVATQTPQLTTRLAEITAGAINQRLAFPYQLTSRDEKLEIGTDHLWQWVKADPIENSFVVYLDHTALNAYLLGIEKIINQPMHNAVFKMTDGQVTEFQPEQPGAVLRIDDTAEQIQSILLSEIRDINLPINYLEPKVKLKDINNLGLINLVAQGTSNFSGSPFNRRHNIKTGADRFDWILIPPGETFSFNQALGEVDAHTGYLPELVIKGDETIPEYGGGLCQVSTTAFRAILNGGYPVVARTNHSYRVSYYEPAGTDATIYPPYPDLKFTNDSEAHILMDTHTEGDNLYFDFYGTSTGRTVELEGPKIYNVTDYPEPVYIETSSIPEGEIQKVDSAHRGAEAVLYRYIYDKSGKLLTKDEFYSKYIPWPAKYLRGVVEAPVVETDLDNVLPEEAALEGPADATN